MKKTPLRKTIGLIVDTISSWDKRDHYQSEIVRGVDGYCRQNGYNLKVFVAGHLDSPYQWEKAWTSLLEMISDKVVDGIIMIPSSTGAFCTRERLDEFVHTFDKFKTVIIGDHFPGIHSVVVDNYTGMKKIMQHIIEHHHKKKIAFVKGIEGNADAETRFIAYKETLAEYSLAFDQSLVYQGNFLFPAGIEAINHYTQNKIEYDAIVCANDNMAIGCLAALDRIKAANVPVTGFDNTAGGKFHSLTTVNQPFYMQAWESANILANLINDIPVREKTIIPSEMIIRSSCGCTQIGKIPLGLDSHAETNLTLFRSSIHDPAILQEANEQIDIICRNIKLCAPDDSCELFTWSWNSFIRWAFRHHIQITVINIVVAYLHDFVNGLALDDEKKSFIQIAISSAESQLYEKAETESAFHLYDQELINDELNFFGEGLLLQTHVDKQMNLAFKTMPSLGFSDCIIAKYNNLDEPMQSATIILAYLDRAQVVCEDAYDSKSLYPQKLKNLLETDRTTLIFQALHCGHVQIGYMATSFSNKNAAILDMLRSKISVGLESALKVEALECTVRSRTLELISANENLSKSLNEKKALFMELQHRVKNNLSIVASLLSLGASSTEIPEAQNVLTEAQTRIQSMATIYEQLYRSPDISSEIELSAYLYNLTRSLLRTYSIDSDRIELVPELDQMKIDMKRAMSIGLIVNELVTNALKYAWPDKQKGSLTISLRLHRDSFVLAVKDDGRGIDPEIMSKKSASLGMSIVNMLSSELNSTVEVISGLGTTMQLTIPVFLNKK